MNQLSQAAGSVDPMMLVLVGIASLLVIFNNAAQAWKTLRGNAAQPPNEQLEYAHRELSKRVDKHDQEFDELWNTMRNEVGGLRKEVNGYVQDYERTLGKIEGELKGIHDQLKALNEIAANTERKK